MVWIACASGYRSGPYILSCSYRFCKWNVHTSCVWLVAIISIIQLLLLLLRMGPLEVPGVRIFIYIIYIIYSIYYIYKYIFRHNYKTGEFPMGRCRIATDKCAKASTKQLHGFPGLDTASGAHLWCHRKICFFFSAKNGRNLALDDWMTTGCPMWMVCFCTSTSCTFVSFVELDWCYDAMISTFWRWKSVKLYLLAIVFKLLFSQACWMLLPCFWHQGCLAQKNDTAHTGGKFTARYWDVRPSTKEFPMPQGLMLNFTLSTQLQESCSTGPSIRCVSWQTDTLMFFERPWWQLWLYMFFFKQPR